MSRKFNVVVKMDYLPQGIAPEDLAEKTACCDSLVVGLIVLDENGVCNQEFMSVDGRTGKGLSEHNIWTFWAGMAMSLSQIETLAGSQRAICKQVSDAVFGRGN